ncbi:porin [Acidovorax sp. GBBC 3334]|uniref:porin n=1 Tax=Acidovorax sp. GBBC 3334 TaxID=2940496 RepID=UPI0023038A19|nr:porin [Acidovorax sp. GBBC 3334]MDA8455649.1 porin [Acidovorax sp. GBBC 3334]
MKETRALSAIVLGCMSSLALAQNAPGSSSVTMYGLVDIGYTHVTGGTGGTLNSITSGNMEGSRLGFKGDENLGGGYRAIFTMESRLEADTGGLSNRPPSLGRLPDRLSSATSLGLPSALQPVVSAVAAQIGNSVGVNLGNSFFDRQIFTGLVTPFGAFTVGRQYTPGYLATAGFDVMKTESSLALGQLVAIPASFDIRVSNSLQYGLQIDGLRATAMYAAGEVAGKATARRLLGVMAMYTGSGYSVGGGYNTRNNELGEKSLTTAIVGATVDIGPGTLHGQYATIKDDHPTDLSTIATSLAGNPATAPVAGLVQNAFIRGFRQDARLFQVGYRITTGPHTVAVAYNNMNDRRPFNADRYSYGAAYTYALSKRTDVSAVLTHLENKNTSQDSLGGNGYIGGVAATPGKDVNSLSLSIRHRF